MIRAGRGNTDPIHCLGALLARRGRTLEPPWRYGRSVHDEPLDPFRDDPVDPSTDLEESDGSNEPLSADETPGEWER